MSVTASDEALEDQIASSLLGLSAVPYVYRTFRPEALTSAAGSQVVARFQGLLGRVEEYEALGAKLQRQVETLAARPANHSCKTLYDSDLQGLSGELARTRAARTALAALLAQLLKEDGSGARALETLGRGEQFASAAEGAYLMVVKFVAAGGDVKSIKGAFSSKLMFAGGAVARYEVAAPAGRLLAAGTVDAYGGFIRDHDLEDRLGSEAQGRP